MDEKLRKICRKYYEAKSMAIIEKHFRGNHPENVWSTLKDQLDKGYLVIPNKACWYRDFALGGTNKVYLTKLFDEPYTYTTDRKHFNTYGNIAVGDTISMLRHCNDSFMDEMIIADLGPFIYLTSYMSMMARHHGRQYDYNYEFCRMADWISRVIASATVYPVDDLNTKFTFQMPSFIYFSNLIHMFSNFVRKNHIEVDVPYKKAGVYSQICNAIIFAVKSNMQLKPGFTVPNYEFFIPMATPLEGYLVECEIIGKNHGQRVAYVQKMGMPRALDKIKKEINAEERKKLDEIIAKADPTEIALVPSEYLQGTYKILKSSLRVKSLKLKEERPFLMDYANREFPIASTTIDLNKLAFDNATKDEEWLLNTCLLLYTNAQEINALRVSFQTQKQEFPLHVTIYNNNDNIKFELEKRISAITQDLKSTYLHNYTYEVKNDNDKTESSNAG